MTHVNYSLEEIEAMIEVGQMDEVDKKQDTKEQRMMFIAFGNRPTKLRLPYLTECLQRCP